MFPLSVTVGGNCICPWYSHRWVMRPSEFLQAPGAAWTCLTRYWDPCLVLSWVSEIKESWLEKESMKGEWLLIAGSVVRSAYSPCSWEGFALCCVGLLAALAYWERDKCCVERRIFRRCYKEKELMWCRSISRIARQGILCVTYSLVQQPPWYLFGALVPWETLCPEGGAVEFEHKEM